MSFLFVAFFLGATFLRIPSFHICLSPPLILRPSASLPVLLALLTGFSKWPSQAAGSLPGAFGDLPGRHLPLSTLSSSACPPLLLLHPSIHPSNPLFSLAQPTSLLISPPHSSASVCSTVSPLRLASFHLCCSFPLESIEQ